MKCVLLTITVFFCLLCDLPLAYAQNEQGLSTPRFNFLLWPEKFSIVHSGTAPLAVQNQLVDAWHDGHLMAYTGKLVHLILPEQDSLAVYLRILQNTRPECVEGDLRLIEHEMNQQERLYVPLLRVDVPGIKNPSAKGEILFFDHTPSWKGTMGVMHPFYGIGGGLQIEKWLEHTGLKPDWVTLYSGQEVLRHFFVGSIQAAAVPAGALDDFLDQHNRRDLAKRVIRVQTQKIDPSPVVFLRKDIYDSLLMRTLIGETWLRDHFPKRFHAFSVLEP